MARKSEEECRRFAKKFFLDKQRFDKSSKEFEDEKKKFYEFMDEYFGETSDDRNGDNKIVFESDELDGISLSVTRVQNTSVKFDADELEKAIGKEYAKSVILKTYEISDMQGLTEYLKKCNVDPKVFRSFLNVSKKVDVKALENLESIGKVNKESLDGCYSISLGSPYFKVNTLRGRGNEKC